ncbi:hypothetical protein A3A66_04910 [Microgenomates group bacterium RIFCSPLOWO2_01_FULL_46_13]|nr:MAG: hypothetical protein A2783_02255 [Microgenomates group bacterium RIFCSPHIGHO2_01_FULL_45_11]OGV94302.1 MAG: hypothetical protein A3A66_04910 [Microgenomates group bacterium RIFCSPLOWO2_01_FULL_46_13]
MTAETLAGYILWLEEFGCGLAPDKISIGRLTRSARFDPILTEEELAAFFRKRDEILPIKSSLDQSELPTE